MITTLFESFWRSNRQVKFSKEESQTLKGILLSYIEVKKRAFDCSYNETLLDEIAEANNLLSKLE